MTHSLVSTPRELIEQTILLIRNKKVMLDLDAFKCAKK
jgi:hypothetical protein